MPTDEELIWNMIKLMIELGIPETEARKYVLELLTRKPVNQE